MKHYFTKQFLYFFFFLFSFSLNAQSYLGYTNNSVNFRSSPSTKSTVYKTLKPGMALFVIDMQKTNGYYSVIDIETNTEGYVHSSYVTISEEIPENTDDVFTPTSESTKYKPEIAIYNRTNENLTLKLNDISFKFSPYERRTIITFVGDCSYIASAPGVIPYYGSQNLASNYEYSWEFYIITE